MFLIWVPINPNPPRWFWKIPKSSGWAGGDQIWDFMDLGKSSSVEWLNGLIVFFRHKVTCLHSSGPPKTESRPGHAFWDRKSRKSQIGGGGRGGTRSEHYFGKSVNTEIQIHSNWGLPGYDFCLVLIWNVNLKIFSPGLRFFIHTPMNTSPLTFAMSRKTLILEARPTLRTFYGAGGGWKFLVPTVFSLKYLTKLGQHQKDYPNHPNCREYLSAWAPAVHHFGGSLGHRNYNGIVRIFIAFRVRGVAAFDFFHRKSKKHSKACRLVPNNVDYGYHTQLCKIGSPDTLPKSKPT